MTSLKAVRNHTLWFTKKKKIAISVKLTAKRSWKSFIQGINRLQHQPASLQPLNRAQLIPTQLIPWERTEGSRARVASLLHLSCFTPRCRFAQNQVIFPEQQAQELLHTGCSQNQGHFIFMLNRENLAPRHSISSLNEKICRWCGNYSNWQIINWAKQPEINPIFMKEHTIQFNWIISIS